MTDVSHIRAQKEKEDKRTGMLISFGIHAILLFLLWFFAATYIPDPPPGEMVVEMAMADYGFDTSGQGQFESEVPSETVEEVVEEQSAETQQVVEASDPDPVVTQETSEVSTPTGNQPTTSNEPTPDPEPQVSDGLSNILDQINNTGGGGSEGGSTGTGNEGNPDGNIDGHGVVGGPNGSDYDLGGRGVLGYAKLSATPREEGRVKIKIWVNRQGEVIKAEVDDSGTNTTSSHLRELARSAAMKAKFAIDNSAPINQTGSITFNFKLQ